MKSRHVDIMNQILNAYKDIELKSKMQYIGFVQKLKEQHSSKVSTYKEVVKVLQEELTNVTQHWEGNCEGLHSCVCTVSLTYTPFCVCCLQGVSHRNKELLEENKLLYQKLKDALEKAQNEKVS